MTNDRTKPTFLGVGPGRAGTSWLYLCLSEHPDIYMTWLKEIHFFSRHYDKGFSWYQEFFGGWKDEHVGGEISPTYISDVEAAKRIHAYVPDVKLIFSLRNPIDRAFSHQKMRIRRGIGSIDLEMEFAPQSQLIQMGMYWSHINRFMSFFSEDQIQIVLYDDLEYDAGAYLRSVYEFLGVNSDFEPTMLNHRYHESKALPRFPYLYRATVSILRRIKHSSTTGSRLVTQLRKSRLAKTVHQINHGGEFDDLPDFHRQRLAAIYAEEVQQLGEHLQRDLSHWLK